MGDTASGDDDVWKSLLRLVCQRFQSHLPRDGITGQQRVRSRRWRTASRTEGVAEGCKSE